MLEAQARARCCPNALRARIVAVLRAEQERD